VYSPAFDVTPAGLITAIIAEEGIFAPADLSALREAKTRT
jgi:methylthioribose-1-phosphate isomerase